MRALTYNCSIFLFTLPLESSLHDFFESTHVPAVKPAVSRVSAPMTLCWFPYIDMPPALFR